MNLFRTITDLSATCAELKKRRYGVIEVVSGKLIGIHFRPWPKIIPMTDAVWMGGWQRNSGKRLIQDQCLVYFNQPLGHSNFLSLPFIVTSLTTSFKTIRRSLAVLDEVARTKKSDAIITEVTNRRITDKMMARLGWERHMQNSRRRHFIRRFYGKYPIELEQQLDVTTTDQNG